MAVGKGSLLRAANAAGKNTKAEEMVSKTKKSVQGEMASKKTESVQEEVSSKRKENAQAEEMAAHAETAGWKILTAVGDADDGRIKDMTEKQVQTEKTKKAKKDASKQLKTEKRAKAEPSDSAVKTKTAEGAGSRKVTKRQAKAVRSAGAQMTWLLTVPAEALQDIPDAWHGAKYVRPNVSSLAESISEYGILEPVPAVQTGENTYQAVGGSKRMQVVQMLGIAEVPVLVLPGASMEDAKRMYQALSLTTGTVSETKADVKKAENVPGKRTQETGNQEKVRKRGLFGCQRIPEYLL